ncbi:hypothetical protein NIES2101_36205 [Calothrix sp. HK-06]|nr:hypothetical protein NIES2101_36205 [Calothrix sp. HK-06]
MYARKFFKKITSEKTISHTLQTHRGGNSQQARKGKTISLSLRCLHLGACMKAKLPFLKTLLTFTLKSYTFITRTPGEVAEWSKAADC